MYIDKFFNQNVSRRDFLQRSGQAALAVGGALTLNALVSSSTTIGFKEQAPVIYPPLEGHKVQPPENGCYIGFYCEGGSDSRWGGTHPNDNVYEGKVGKKPKIMSIDLRCSSSSFFAAEKVE